MRSNPYAHQVERLELRRLFAAVSWDGGGNGSDWTDPLNWSTDALPGAADDVTIDVPGAPTIRFWGTTETFEINSLNCAEAFRLVLGKLEIAADSVMSGPMTHEAGYFFGAGDLSITQSLTLSGGVMGGEGATRIEPGATLLVDGDLRQLGRLIENAGTASFVNSQFYFGAFSFTSRAILRNLAGATVTLAGFNDWFNNGHSPLIENAGTFTVTADSYLNSGIPFDNTGTLRVQGEPVYLGAQSAQLSGQTLTGGTWIVEDGATLSFHSSVVLRTNQADVTLNGLGASFPNLDTLTTNAGRLALNGGHSFSTSPAGGTFTNSGRLEVGSGSTLAVAGQFAQTSSATLSTSIAPPGAAGRVTVTASATLDGTLDAALAGGFVPTLGDAFDVVSAASRLGTFATVNRPQVDGVMLDPVYSATAATLLAVPDTIAPSVTAAEFAFDTPAQQITIRFSESVSASLSTADLLLENLTTGQSVPAADMALTYDPATNLAAFAFPGFSNGILPDGDYRATLAAATVSDVAGNDLPQDFTFDFFFLNGDANRDRVVNANDFSILATNFGLSGRNFNQGDFNYDTIVNANDFSILATRFGTALAPQSRSIFGRSRISNAARDDEISADLDSLLN